jgi:hypothetical protein
MKKVLKLVVLAIMVMIFAGCGKYPQTELTTVENLITEIKILEGDKYLPNEFNIINDSLNNVLISIESQKSKSSLFRNFKSVTKDLNNIIVLGDSLKLNIEVKKQEVKSQAEQTFAETNTLINEVKELIKVAPTGKDGKLALESISADLFSVEESLPEVTSLLESGDYLTALTKITALCEKTTALKTELQEVINKYL